ncbi:MAG: glycosyltransferase family 2 protein [Clostridia bacterium]|nr:glycosyltransferase family 2 protein [Clostridia bacterium]
MHKLFAMLPCYNEEKDISPLVNKWMEIQSPLAENGYDLTVYCVNDCSTDSTKSVIETLTAEFPDTVHLIDHEINKGLGGVLMTAFRFFLEHGETGDICVLMDGDNTHDPIFCISMLPKLAAGADCVIASRYCTDSETKGVAPIRLFMSWGAKVYYSLLLGVKNVRDYTCGYRAYTYDILEKAYQKYGDNLVERRSFACMMEALYKLSLIGARFDEVPFELRYDHKEGESKMRVLKTAKDSLSTALNLRLHTKK